MNIELIWLSCIGTGFVVSGVIWVMCNAVIDCNASARTLNAAHAGVGAHAGTGGGTGGGNAGAGAVLLLLAHAARKRNPQPPGPH